MPGEWKDARGVIVTAPADTDAADFVSRFFAPAAGAAAGAAAVAAPKPAR